MASIIYHQANKESGAALVVGLILLLVLSLLAISTMNTASLELVMAGNAQYSENAFQLAETGLDTNIQNINNGAPLPPPGIPNCPAAASLAAAGTPVNVPVLNGSYSVANGYCGDTPDFGGGSSLGKIRQYHYRADSQGITTTRGASSLHRQGFYKRGPDGS